MFGLDKLTSSNLMTLDSIKCNNLLFLTYVNAVHNQYQLNKIDYQNVTNGYYYVLDKPT